jgi:hypothetical protein
MQPRSTSQPTWSQTLPAPPCGLQLAREKGTLLVWDKADWLYLLNRRGERQAQWKSPGPLAAACCADDGSAYVAAGSSGDFWWLAPDFTVRWQGQVPHPATAAALDPFGQYLALATQRGGLHVFNHLGKPVSQTESPRPFRHLLFVPAAPVLVGCAEYGLVACFGLTGRQMWRDGLVANVGSLASSGDGRQLVLACHGEVLHRYRLDGGKQDGLVLDEPCPLAAVSFDGRRVLAATASKRLLVVDMAGKTLGTYRLEGQVVGLALSALADQAAVALGDGRVMGLALNGARSS